MEPAARARLHLAVGKMARDQSLTEAREYFEETLKWAQQTEDHALICQALFQVSTTFHYDRDNYDLAMNLCRQALDEAEKAGDKGLVGEVLNEVGNLHHSSLGDGEAVAEAHQEALEILRETANDRYVSVALGNVAGAAERRGDYHAALHLKRESLSTGWELQSPLLIAWAIQHVALCVSAAGGAQYAARLLGAAERAFTMAGIIGLHRFPWEIKPVLEKLTQQLGSAPFEALTAEGQAMTIPQAVAYALQEDVPQATGSTSKLSASP